MSSSCDIFPPTWVRIYSSFGLIVNSCHCKSKDAGASYERMWFLKSICCRVGNPMIVQRLELFFFRLPNGKPAAFSQSGDYWKPWQPGRGQLAVIWGCCYEHESCCIVLIKMITYFAILCWWNRFQKSIWKYLLWQHKPFWSLPNELNCDWLKKLWLFQFCSLYIWFIKWSLIVYSTGYCK